MEVHDVGNCVSALIFKPSVRQASLISIQPYYKVLKAKLTGSRTAQMCVKNDQIFAFYRGRLSIGD